MDDDEIPTIPTPDHPQPLLPGPYVVPTPHVIATERTDPDVSAADRDCRNPRTGRTVCRPGIFRA